MYLQCVIGTSKLYFHFFSILFIYTFFGLERDGAKRAEERERGGKSTIRITMKASVSYHFIPHYHSRLKII